MQQTWCIGKIDAAFLARLEQILALYALPYDPAYPVVCFDERPCFLIGDTLLPRPMRKGEIAKQHYEYEKLGSCALLAAVEPLTGRRLGLLYERRTKREFTLFCQALAAQYPDATKIRLVLDNLNTHVQWIAFFCPEQASFLEDVRKLLITHVPRVDPDAYAFCHGDFRCWTTSIRTTPVRSISICQHPRRLRSQSGSSSSIRQKAQVG